MGTGSMRFVWSAAVLLVTGFALLGGRAQAGQDNTRGAVVDQTLVAKLQANPTGGLVAIVTTWDRSGLDAVQAAGISGPRLSVLPMIITAGLTQPQLDKLRAMPQVRSVWGQRTYRAYMEDTTWITKARYAWAQSNGTSARPWLRHYRARD
jgi:hypothetical protein